MMTALPLMTLPPAPISIVTIARPAIAPVASFDAVLADVVQQTLIKVSVTPTGPAVDHIQMGATVEPPERDLCAPAVEEASESVSLTGLQAEPPTVTETVKVAATSESMDAAQIIAVAAQLASSPARPATASEIPRQNSIAVRAKKADATVRLKSVNITPEIAKPRSGPAPAETTTPEIEPVSLSVAGLQPVHQPAVETSTLNLPTIAAPVNLQPQIFHDLDLARDLAWIDNLAQDIVAASDDRDRLSFRLMPRSLGQLDVDLSRSPEGLRVDMAATTERATQIIAAEQPRLIEELRQSGVKLLPADLATGQHNGSQRHWQHRPELPFAADKPQPPTAKSPDRPNGRFA